MLSCNLLHIGKLESFRCFEKPWWLRHSTMCDLEWAWGQTHNSPPNHWESVNNAVVAPSIWNLSPCTNLQGFQRSNSTAPLYSIGGWSRLDSKGIQFHPLVYEGFQRWESPPSLDSGIPEVIHLYPPTSEGLQRWEPSTSLSYGNPKAYLHPVVFASVAPPNAGNLESTAVWVPIKETSLG